MSGERDRHYVGRLQESRQVGAAPAPRAGPGQCTRPGRRPPRPGPAAGGRSRRSLPFLLARLPEEAGPAGEEEGLPAPRRVSGAAARGGRPRGRGRGGRRAGAAGGARGCHRALECWPPAGLVPAPRWQRRREEPAGSAAREPVSLLPGSGHVRGSKGDVHGQLSIPVVESEGEGLRRAKAPQKSFLL